MGFQNDDSEVHTHTFNLTNFNVVDDLLDTLDGPIVVRRQNYRSMRVERLRARHEKWNVQLDKLASAYLGWAQTSSIGEKTALTGCSGDVDAPPLQTKTFSGLAHFFTIFQVLGSHCKSSYYLTFKALLTHKRGPCRHGNRMDRLMYLSR